MSKQSEEFEAWCKECGYNTEAFKGILELAWQASRAAALEEIDKICDDHDLAEYVSARIRVLKLKEQS